MEKRAVKTETNTGEGLRCNKIRYGREIRKNGHGICPACRQSLPYVLEPRCMKCGKPVRTEEQEYCTDCTRHDLAFEQGRSVWTHTGNVPQAVYQFKFHNKRYYAEIFAQAMWERYGRWIGEKKIKTIIPVPLHPSKRRRRGFNQAELLAEELGKRAGLPVEARAVIRLKKTRPQKQLNHNERQRNLKGAFGVKRDWSPVDTVLLVDDIYTTGNTIHRIAKVLQRAGVQKVYFLTISIGQEL